MKRVLFALLGALLITTAIHAGFGSERGFGGMKRKFLSPEEAFKVQVEKLGDQIEITIKLGKKIHIYAKDLHFRIVKPKNFELKVEKPKSVVYEGDQVYYGVLKIPIPLSKITKKVRGPFTLQVELTGCSDAGICYQQQKYTFDFGALTPKSSEDRGKKQAKTASSTLNAQRSTLLF